MNNKFTKKKDSPVILILGWVVSFIFFLIGFYHTGQGLQSYQVLGMKYGSFIISFGILMLMIISYTKAVSGSKLALMFYVLFALVNFTCNLNSFYPNDQGEYLYKKELEEKKLAITGYQSEIDKAFLNKSVMDKSKTAENFLGQLSEQIMDGGFKDKSKALVKMIEGTLDLADGSITLLSSGNNQTDYANIAHKYISIIGDKINKYKESHGATNPLINDIANLKEVYVQLLDKKIKDPHPFINHENTEDKATSDFLLRDLVSKMENFKVAADESAKKYNLNLHLPKQVYINNEFGKFSHTFRSIGENTSQAGTWYVIAICLLIDFIIPLSMYFLIRKKEGEESNNPFDRVFNRKPKLQSF
ncbi:hypothetical protein H9Q08_17510 [Chryseobacterium sp. PS-8]|uniref:DUF4407 domain-containing protein n=1 Tax=Chryseobacterium indicum TaxID=2766954 RepID=A0ABS9C927_9FLAO|nr:hypothetical protein [Chryseobacterium sp. PS-8]MCF2221087.1 hypothetical protein [Chryseobacterium sp. PS-8]